MKKRLDTEAITNELKGSSLFFQRRQEKSASDQAPPSPPVYMDSQAVQLPDAPSQGAEERPPSTPRSSRTGRTPVRPVRRRLRRHAFDIFDDQLDTLREQAMRDRLSGGDGSMSRMVREALDRYIKKKEKE